MPLMLNALTRLEVTCVLAKLDTREMESTVVSGIFLYLPKLSFDNQ